MGQADYRPNIHWMYQSVRRIADLIFIGVYRGQADYQPNIHWCIQGSGGLPTEYSLMYTGVRRMIDQILIRHRNGSSGLLRAIDIGPSGLSRAIDVAMLNQLEVNKYDI